MGISSRDWRGVELNEFGGSIRYIFLTLGLQPCLHRALDDFRFEAVD